MIIIDAYNVLHQTGVLPPRLAGMEVPGLIRLIGTSRYARERITIVCDGGGGTTASGASRGLVRVLFSGHDAEADDLIEGLIDRFGHGGALTVVSSDKRLRRAARRRGAESVESGDFLRQLAADADRAARGQLPAFATAIPLDRYSVDHWLHEFGLPAPETRGASAASAPPPPVSPAGPDAPPPRAPGLRPSPRRAASELRAHTGGAKPFGERLTVPIVPLHRMPPAASPQPVAPTPIPPPDVPAIVPPSPPYAAPHAAPPVAPVPAGEIDPVLVRALQEWGTSLRLDDLDMRRWVPTARPLTDAQRRRR